eukprot:scaffold24201_cov56-Phaeocystis_antarctica.AAC.1
MGRLETMSCCATSTRRATSVLQRRQQTCATDRISERRRQTLQHFFRLQCRKVDVVQKASVVFGGEVTNHGALHRGVSRRADPAPHAAV